MMSGLGDNQLRSKKVVRINFSKPARDQMRVISKSHDSSAKNSKVSVQSVINTQRPIKNNPSTVTFGPSLKQKSKPILKKSDTEGVSKKREDSCFKFAVPELCTSLRIANNILETAASEREKKLGSSLESKDDISDEAKVKVLKKINIPFEEKIYKDLVALKVTNEDLYSGQDNRKLKSKNIERIKDKEPELVDFYNPSFDTEFIVKCEPVLSEKEKVTYFDGFSITNCIRNWEYQE